MARSSISRRVKRKSNPWATLIFGDVTTLTVGAKVATTITVAVQLKDDNANNLAVRGHVGWFLSDDANGDSLAATAADGGVAVGTNGWVSSDVTGKRGVAVSEANGTIDIAVTHSGTANYYLGLRLPDGSVKMSGVVLAF